MTEAAKQRTYLNHVLQRTGWTQSELAVRAGLDPSTLSRFLSSAREGHAMRSRSLAKIEAVSGIAFDGSGNRVEAAPGPQPGFGESEATPLQVTSQSPLAAVIDTLTRQRANADPWVLRSRALEGAGYRPGDVLMVALGETPLSGDVVCAQVYDWVSGRAETIFRIFDPPYLVAASPDPKYLRPYVVDDAKVRIKGVVVHSLRGRNSFD